MPGDTIVVNVLDYQTATRDTSVVFPDAGIGFEKVILRYGMRCKGARVSTGSDRNRGCGEWDYSCNTFVVDSSKVERESAMHPDARVSGFAGDTFAYVAGPVFDHYRYLQTEVEATVLTETVYYPGVAGEDYAGGIRAGSRSGQMVFHYTAAELANSGLTAGPIEGLRVELRGDTGRLRHLRIEMAAIDGDELHPGDFDELVFEELYYRNTELVPGDNRLVFTEGYNWNGTSGLVFKMHYTSEELQDEIIWEGMPSEGSMSFAAHDNAYVDFSHEGRLDIDAELLERIGEELTVSIWLRGHADALPANTSLLWGYDENPANRALNLHLPWGNGQVYFDCGFDGGYDRINKQAAEAEYEGQWNFWTFTKNARTGDMRIYLNGELWHSGTGLHRPVSMKNLVLGMTADMTNNYKGDVGELRIWDVALNEQQIADWQRLVPDESHPEFEHLVLHLDFAYKGEVQQTEDALTGEVFSGKNMFWKRLRGEELYRGYRRLDVKPRFGLLQGEYDRVLREEAVIDAVRRTPNVVQLFDVVSNEGTALDDEIVEIDVFEAYEARAEFLYDAATGDVLDEYPVVAEDSLVIGELDYVRRFPFYNEIMSFVTPYGIGLDLGAEGKAWYFDVTDFVPLLQGRKRILMTMGGQYQEEMDLDFLFVVGTPPRDVLHFDQLWQGGARWGSVHINTIRSDGRFAPIDYTLAPEAVGYKLRSTITGHGSEGEFHQNGGLVYHMFNLEGGFEELVWPITQECSENPVYPQGGTWVIDRQGWCPGERSLLVEEDITDFVTAGSTIELDYNVTEPNVSSGDYRYIVAHQLVSYGPPNHRVDAAITEIRKPSDNVLYTRLNPGCDRPVVRIVNTGSEPLTSARIRYRVAGSPNVKTYEWVGSLDFLEGEDVTLPDASIFSGLEPGGMYGFQAEIVVEGDEYPHNNRMGSRFRMVNNHRDGLIIELRTNARHFENRYVITDGEGNVVSSDNLQFGNRAYRDTISEPGCYVFQIRDTGGDGLEWWANPNQGSGYIVLKDMTGRNIRTLESDFGGELSYRFTVGTLTGVERPAGPVGYALFPNPAAGRVQVEGLVGGERLSAVDMLGREWPLRQGSAASGGEVDISALAAGLYFLRIEREGRVEQLKFYVVN